jgi:hypothetical protein
MYPLRRRDPAATHRSFGDEGGWAAIAEEDGK